MGLFDQLGALGNLNPDQTQGLLAAAQAFAQAGAPSRTPVGFAQALASGLGGYNQGLQSAQKQRQDQEQLAQTAKLLGLKIRDAESDIENQDAVRQRAQQLRQFYISQGQNAGQPNLQVLGGNAAPTLDNSARLQAASTAQGGNNGGIYQQRLAEAQALRAQGFGPEADAAEAAALKFQPAVDSWESIRVDGKIYKKPYFKDGTSGEYIPAELAEKLEKVNIGGKTLLTGELSGNTYQSFNNSQSPDSAASVAAQIRGQDLTDKRARDLNDITREANQTQIINDPLRGPLLVNKGTGKTTQAVDTSGSPVMGSEKIKNIQGAQKLIPVIQDAEKLIKSATGSYGGAGLDQAARLFGVSTQGAQNTARLKVLESQLILNMPRLEGPQSDKDTMLYRQAAAQIGDPTVPVQQKQAALDTLTDVTYRNAGMERPKSDDMGSSNNGKYSITAPNGKTYNFPDAQSLANFKLSTGIK